MNILILIFILCVTGLAKASYPRCGTNEIWKRGCPDPTCENPKPLLCGYFPYGCRCYDGYVRDARGKCIPSKDCPQNKCSGPNEIWKKYGCKDSTCENPEPLKCGYYTPGCYCQDGYVRDKRGQCILKKNCPNQNVCSGENEVWKHACPDATCDNPEPVLCGFYTPGCYCEDGYVRNSWGQCVLTGDCPRQPQTCTGQNESWRRGCADSTCENPEPLACGYFPYRCRCFDGYVRDAQGKCIPSDKCPGQPQVCTERNVSWQKCHGGCDGTCENPEPGCYGCIDGCFCNKGYVRGPRGDCIPYSRCFYRS